MISKLLLFAPAVLAQQVYVSASGPPTRSQCSVNNTYATALPSYSFQGFSFTQTETVRTATSVPAPTTTTSFAPPYTSLSHLIPNLTTTQWGNWDPSITSTPTDAGNPYGNASWSALWNAVPLSNFTRGIYSSTVSPTPIPTNELVLPPLEYFKHQDCYSFPSSFMLGVAGSAVQIEGAIADEGRTPGMMDILTVANPSASPDYVTNENYYLYKQDIERIAAMGVKYYSFSIPWARILPFVVPGAPVNKQGLDHYDDLVNFVLSKGMLPTVTLIHTDTPLQFYPNISGTLIPSGTGIGYVDLGFQRSYQNVSFEDAFVHYGKVLMTHFADRVPVWFTFNEPLLGSRNGKSINAVLKAHARLYHFYKEEVNGAGKVSIKFNDNFGVPRNPQDPTDVEAANHFNSFQLANFANPIFLGKDYPSSYKNTIKDHVPLTASDLAYINGTADFFSIDPYTATVVSPPPNSTVQDCASNSSHPLRPYCVTQSTTTTTGWNIGYRSQSYVYITPIYFRTYLFYLRNTFRSPIAITEFGFPVFAEAEKALSDQLFDSPRSCFADNWEFGDFEQRFGIQTVNRTTQERRYKRSFFEFVDFVESRRQEA
ncbi:glycoside hydrolase family 1 protein [Lentithecium fluviatile CBS 122367]|uniref:Glycoside hydrolase family 1 protein n=1 Tax=Lentithecium fluviatile CBS 122367 TaxID=1168545 RepID=A0A6G1JDI0_9PLEO|nr:glycoside hydrolase family 1 protein [Lentithecium fluviatile CBS 122367]